jgi:hypothetical protein
MSAAGHKRTFNNVCQSAASWRIADIGKRVPQKPQLSGSHSCRAHRALRQKFLENFSKTRCALVMPYFPPGVRSVLAKGGFSLAIRLGKEAFFPVRVLLRFSIILEGLRSRARQTDVQSLGR